MQVLEARRISYTAQLVPLAETVRVVWTARPVKSAPEAPEAHQESPAPTLNTARARANSNTSTKMASSRNTPNPKTAQRSQHIPEITHPHQLCPHPRARVDTEVRLRHRRAPEEDTVDSQRRQQTQEEAMALSHHQLRNLTPRPRFRQKERKRLDLPLPKAAVKPVMHKGSRTAPRRKTS